MIRLIRVCRLITHRRLSIISHRRSAETGSVRGRDDCGPELGKSEEAGGCKRTATEKTLRRRSIHRRRSEGLSF